MGEDWELYGVILEYKGGVKMKIVLEDVPGDFLSIMNELHSKLTIIATQANKARQLIQDLNQRLGPKMEEESEPEVDNSS